MRPHTCVRHDRAERLHGRLSPKLDERIAIALSGFITVTAKRELSGICMR